MIGGRDGMEARLVSNWWSGGPINSFAPWSTRDAAPLATSWLVPSELKTASVSVPSPRLFAASIAPS